MITYMSVMISARGIKTVSARLAKTIHFPSFESVCLLFFLKEEAMVVTAETERFAPLGGESGGDIDKVISLDDRFGSGARSTEADVR